MTQVTHTSAQLAAIETFLVELQKMQDRENGGTIHHVTYSIQQGPRYARIVEKRQGEQHGSVYCFIEIATGDMFKSAGWKAPAKHARGSINTPTHGIEFTGRYGLNYLRGVNNENYAWRK